MSEKTSEAESKRTVYYLAAARSGLSVHNPVHKRWSYLIPISVILCYVLRESSSCQHHDRCTFL